MKDDYNSYWFVVFVGVLVVSLVGSVGVEVVDSECQAFKFRHGDDYVVDVFWGFLCFCDEWNVG